MFTKLEDTYLSFLVIILALIIMVCPILAACGVFHSDAVAIENYAMTAIVIETDCNSDMVTIKDANGNKWQFYSVEDWEVNDCVSLIMCDNGTPQIFDDIIVITRYNSWYLLGK